MWLLSRGSSLQSPTTSAPRCSLVGDGGMRALCRISEQLALEKGAVPSSAICVIARGIMNAAFWMSNASWMEMDSPAGFGADRP